MPLLPTAIGPSTVTAHFTVCCGEAELKAITDDNGVEVAASMADWLRIERECQQEVEGLSWEERREAAREDRSE